MNGKDFAGHCALEATSRAARILPVLQSYLDINELPGLTEVQQVALGSVILQLFDGITDTLERMSDVNETLHRLAPVSLGDQIEQWLADQDGPLQ